METENKAATTSRAMLWTGYIISTLAILFFLMDGIVKLIAPPEVADISKKLGYADSTMTAIGIAIIIWTVLYAIPQTSILGAVLLTAHLGGAIAAHVRVSAPANNQGFGGEPFNIIFPVIIGLFVWGGLYFRDSRLRNLIPLLK